MGASSVFNLGKKVFDNEAMAKIFIIAILLLLFVIAFVIILHLYAKCLLQRSTAQSPGPTTVVVRRRRRRVDFPQGASFGLDPTVLKTIPILTFVPEAQEKGIECAVCLSEVMEGEKFRLLPKCHHGFHADCIDMWFRSHWTCPLCRCPVSDQEPKSPSVATLDTMLQSAIRRETSNPHEQFLVLSLNARVENARFPTNVLFWGNEAQVSTRTVNIDDDANVATGTSSSFPSSGMVAVDIPREAIVDEEEEQSGVVTTRLRSLKRLLSRDRRVNPCSPSSDGTLL